MTIEAQDNLDRYFTLAEADANAAEFYTQRSTAVFHRFGEWLPWAQKKRQDWLTAEDDEAKLIRRVHARLSGETARRPRGRLISVQAYADALGVSRSTADRLLAEGRVQGAVRKTPGVKNSPWLIPESAIAKHFESWRAAS